MQVIFFGYIMQVILSYKTYHIFLIYL